MRNRHQIDDYFEALKKEIDHVASFIDVSRKVTQIHWGGGTPNSVPLKYISQVMEQVKSLFTFHAEAEVAMECSPAYLSLKDIDELADMGFNRISLGIQDFNEDVLSAVNRKPSRHKVEELIQKLRSAGFKGINLDLIYGLPLQTPENFTDTVLKAVDAGPDRIVTFSYAHVPWVNKNQKILEKMGLPSAARKLDLFFIARRLLTGKGYVPVGMDHYAREDDELAVALRHKQLHRNFQGYCTRDRTGQVYAFGSSAISQLFNSYWQNFKNPDKYIEEINQHGIAMERGYCLNNKEQVTRAVINEVMCNGYVDFKFIAAHFNMQEEEITDIVQYDPEKFNDFIEDRLIEILPAGVRVKQTGMLVIRNIAMLFDTLTGKSTRKFSKTI